MRIIATVLGDRSNGKGGTSKFNSHSLREGFKMNYLSKSENSQKQREPRMTTAPMLFDLTTIFELIVGCSFDKARLCVLT